MSCSICDETTFVLMTTRLTANQIKEYFPYMDVELSAKYMAAILFGQKTFDVGKGLIEQWEALRLKGKRK